MPKMVVANSEQITLHNSGFTRHAWNLLYAGILIVGYALYALITSVIGQSELEKIGPFAMGWAGLVYGMVTVITAIAIGATVESKILQRQLTSVLEDTLGYTAVTLKYYNTFYALDREGERAKFMLVRVSRVPEKLSGRGDLIDTYKFLHLDVS